MVSKTSKVMQFLIQQKKLSEVIHIQSRHLNKESTKIIFNKFSNGNVAQREIGILLKLRSIEVPLSPPSLAD